MLNHSVTNESIHHDVYFHFVSQNKQNLCFIHGILPTQFTYAIYPPYLPTRFVSRWFDGRRAIKMPLTNLGSQSLPHLHADPYAVSPRHLGTILIALGNFSQTYSSTAGITTVAQLTV